MLCVSTKRLPGAHMDLALWWFSSPCSAVEAPADSPLGLLADAFALMLYAADTLADDPRHLAEQLFERLKDVAPVHPQARVYACRHLSIGGSDVFVFVS